MRVPTLFHFSKETETKVGRLLDLAAGSIEQLQQLQRNQAQWNGSMGAVRGVPFPSSPVAKEDEEWLNTYLEQIGPDIRKQTEELIRSQVREAMLMGGNLQRLKELFKRKGPPKLVRKPENMHDSLYLQFGDGLETEIEEIYLLG